MARSYGALVPVPAERVRETADGDVITLAGRRCEVAHTPGHARHHHCLWDETTRGWFTGDTFGLSYREFDSARGAWIVPTTRRCSSSLRRCANRCSACWRVTRPACT